MLYVIKGGKYTPFEEGYESGFYLLSFDKDARNNRGYIKKLKDDEFKLYFKWDWRVTDMRVNKGKNYKYFEQLDSAIKFLIDIQFSDIVSLARWNGSFVEIIELYP